MSALAQFSRRPHSIAAVLALSGSAGADAGAHELFEAFPLCRGRHCGPRQALGRSGSAVYGPGCGAGPSRASLGCLHGPARRRQCACGRRRGRASTRRGWGRQVSALGPLWVGRVRRVGPKCQQRSFADDTSVSAENLCGRHLRVSRGPSRCGH